MIDALHSAQPDHEYGTPLKPDRTRDDVGKKNLANTIVAGFWRIPLTQGVDFLRFLRFLANPQIWLRDKNCIA